MIDAHQDEIREGAYADYTQAKREHYNYQRWLLDDSDEMSYLQNSLRGITRDFETGEMKVDPSVRLMNDKGARVLTETILLPIIKNIKLSYYDENQILDRMKKNMKSLNRHLHLNMEEYAIKFENINAIILIIEDVVDAVYNRALYGAEQQRIMTTQKVISEEKTSFNPESYQMGKQAMRGNEPNSHAPWKNIFNV